MSWPKARASKYRVKLSCTAAMGKPKSAATSGRAGSSMFKATGLTMAMIVNMAIGGKDCWVLVTAIKATSFVELKLMVLQVVG